MLRQLLIGASMVLAVGHAGSVLAAADTGCSVAAFEASAADAIKACTALLDGPVMSAPDRAEALKIRARSLRRLNRSEDAVRDYEAALKLAPNDPELHVRRGWIASEQKDAARVFAHAEQAIRLKSDYAAAYDLLGAGLHSAGSEHFAAAKAAYDQAIKLDPRNVHFRFNRFTLLKINEQYEDAVRDADALLAMPADVLTKPGATTYYRKKTTMRIAVALERALVLRTMGRIDEARQAHDEAVARDPDALTYTWRAKFRGSQASYRPGEPKPSQQLEQEDVDKALALDPDFWSARDTLAGLLSLDGKHEAAAREYARALELFPINGEMRWWYARELRQLGKFEDAGKEAITAFELDPAFMMSKVGDLHSRGYVAKVTGNADPRPAFFDAARACMLDKECR